MSLIVTIPTPQGIVLASDSMMTIGQVRERTPKIHRLSEQICWSATGEFALIQRIQHALLAYQDTPLRLKDLEATLAAAIKQAVRELLAMDFRTEIFLNNLGALSSLHRAEFIFTEWSEGPRVLHFSTIGAPEWISDRPYANGNGEIFAGILLQRYQKVVQNISSASVLAYRVVSEAIDCGCFGLGGPVDLWQISPDGLRQLNDEETFRIGETVNAIRKQENAIFEKHLLSATPQ